MYERDGDFYWLGVSLVCMCKDYTMEVIEPYKVLHRHPATAEERRENWLHLQQWEKRRLEAINRLYHQQGGEGELKKADPAFYHHVVEAVIKR